MWIFENLKFSYKKCMKKKLKSLIFNFLVRHKKNCCTSFISHDIPQLPKTQLEKKIM